VIHAHNHLEGKTWWTLVEIELSDDTTFGVWAHDHDYGTALWEAMEEADYLSRFEETLPSGEVMIVQPTLRLTRPAEQRELF